MKKLALVTLLVVAASLACSLWGVLSGRPARQAPQRTGGRPGPRRTRRRDEPTLVRTGWL